MDSYLVDEAVLGQFVDTLIETKYPSQPAENFATVKKDAVANLDHQILKAIFSQLTPEQGKELNDLLDENNTDPEVFGNFFSDYHIDLEEVIKDTMLKFKDEFLGGQNA